jgi:hypothetical protein
MTEVAHDRETNALNNSYYNYGEATSYKASFWVPFNHYHPSLTFVSKPWSPVQVYTLCFARKNLTRTEVAHDRETSTLNNGYYNYGGCRSLKPQYTNHC